MYDRIVFLCVLRTMCTSAHFPHFLISYDEMIDYYNILQLPSRSVSFEEIKLQYRKLLLRYHPDKVLQRGESTLSPVNVDEELNLIGSSSKEAFPASNTFELIQKAWEILNDEVKKRKYDEELKQYDAIGSSAELVQLTEFDVIYEDEDSQSTIKLWKKSCRCGEDYEVYFLKNCCFSLRYDFDRS